MPQTSVLPQWKADYPILTPRQKPSGIRKDVSRTASASSWAAGKVTLTVPSLADTVGTVYSMVVSGFTPAGYNGSVNGTIASATSITYPLAVDPGLSTVQGTVKYTAVVPLVISTTLPANAVPNKAMYAAGTPIMMEAEEPPAEEPPA